MFWKGAEGSGLLRIEFVANDGFDDRLEDFACHLLQYVGIHLSEHPRNQLVHVGMSGLRRFGPPLRARFATLRLGNSLYPWLEGWNRCRGSLPGAAPGRGRGGFGRLRCALLPAFGLGRLNFRSRWRWGFGQRLCNRRFLDFIRRTRYRHIPGRGQQHSLLCVELPGCARNREPTVGRFGFPCLVTGSLMLGARWLERTHLGRPRFLARLFSCFCADRFPGCRNLARANLGELLFHAGRHCRSPSVTGEGKWSFRRLTLDRRNRHRRRFRRFRQMHWLRCRHPAMRSTTLCWGMPVEGVLPPIRSGVRGSRALRLLIQTTGTPTAPPRVLLFLLFLSDFVPLLSPPVAATEFNGRLRLEGRLVLGFRGLKKTAERYRLLASGNLEAWRWCWSWKLFDRLRYGFGNAFRTRCRKLRALSGTQRVGDVPRSRGWRLFRVRSRPQRHSRSCQR